MAVQADKKAAGRSLRDPKIPFQWWYWFAALGAILLIQSLYVQASRIASIPYSRFQALLEQGKVSEVAIAQNQVRGTLKAAEPDGVKQFVTTRVDPEFAAKLDQQHVTYSGVIESTWWRDLLSWILPTAFFIAVWMFIIRRMGQGGVGAGLLSIGKSRAKVFVEKETKVTFADVAGVDEAKAELVEIVSFLRDPTRYGRLGGRAPKGILLIGPPGTGKTLLARAVAGEAQVPFFSISGSEFVEMFVGVGAARVRDLFEQARALAPAIVFIDELDSLGRARGAYGLGGHDEKEQTLNQLLAELDGFDPTSGVVLLAATNRPEILDPALLRAGRFDRQVLVDRPDKKGRQEILGVHLRKAKLGSDVSAEEIAALTPGFTGADLANLVNEAALLATRREADAVSMSDFNNAIERIVAGLEKRNRIMSLSERRIVAFHELGHAFVALAIPGVDVVHKVSIIPRGVGALGYTIQRPTEDRYLMTATELRNKMAVLLGGRAAEQVIIGDASTGAADDLARATDIARAMVLRYGMSPALGNVAYDRDRSPLLQGLPASPDERSFGEGTAREVDGAVKALVEGAFGRAVGILEANRALIEHTAEQLLASETLDQADIRAVGQQVTPERSMDSTVAALDACPRAPYASSTG